MNIQILTTEYLQSLQKRRLSACTITSREASLRKFSKWLNSRNYSVIDVGEEQLRDFQNQLQSRHKTSTVRAHFSILRNFYLWLWQNGFVFDNPFANFGVLPKVDRLPVVLSENKILELFEKLPQEAPMARRNKALLEVTYSSLLRRKELIQLKLADINFETNVLRIIGKRDKAALLPFGECARTALLDYLHNERAQLLKEKSSPFLWINKWGRSLTYSDMGGILRSLKKSTGIDVDWHTLRRSGATHMLKNGASLLMIQKMLCHSTLKAVKHYLRLDIKDLKQTHKKARGLQ